MTRAVYFGAGSDAERVMRARAAEEAVLYFVDNDQSRHGSRFLGLEVRSPSALLSGGFDRVRIVCGATWAAVGQLQSLGVPREKIAADVLETRNLAFLKSLPGKHTGRRAFIVGNGPSLRLADLDAIQDAGDVSFAFNKIYLAFGETRFRPGYYMVDDRLVAQSNAGAISALRGFPKLFPDVLLRWVEKDADTYVFGMTFQDRAAPVSRISESPLNLYSGWTVAYTALQMALLMGCDPICLVGMDFDYAGLQAGQAEGDVLVQTDARNHFHAAYRVRGERWLKPNPEFSRKSFESARALASRKQVRILNATRGGKLDVFERVPFEALAGQPSCEPVRR